MEPTIPSRVSEILEFWFGSGSDADLEHRQPLWFSKDPAFDQLIRERFLADYEKAAAGALDDWKKEPRGCLALILLLDQFSRNMFRGTPRAFATDPQALALAKEAVANAFDRVLRAIERAFVYLPFEHSENLADQRESVRLFSEAAEAHPELWGFVPYAVQHLEIIERFGRFPHRNAILGRRSTPEELEFLSAPDHPSF